MARSDADERQHGVPQFRPVPPSHGLLGYYPYQNRPETSNYCKSARQNCGEKPLQIPIRNALETYALFIPGCTNQGSCDKFPAGWSDKQALSLAITTAVAVALAIAIATYMAKP